MSIVSVAPGRIGRTYTRARRHPWVLGKVGDWTLPLGPYTPAQLAIAAVGVFVLIKTFALWSPLGPVPVVALGFVVWSARASRIGGRSPLWVAYGWAQYALRPRSGRMSGRTVRERRTDVLHGIFLIEDTTAPPVFDDAATAQVTDLPRGTRETRRTPALPAAGKAAARRRGRRRPATARPAPTARPMPTPLQQLLRDRQQGVRR